LKEEFSVSYFKRRRWKLAGLIIFDLTRLLRFSGSAKQVACCSGRAATTLTSLGFESPNDGRESAASSKIYKTNKLEMSSSSSSLLVLYGSETGTAEDVAYKVYSQLVAAEAGRVPALLVILNM